MINVEENNKLFADLVIELLENKYDILFTNKVLDYDKHCNRLVISFCINLHDITISRIINYRTQKIDDLVTSISEQINSVIVKSYLK